MVGPRRHDEQALDSPLAEEQRELALPVGLLVGRACDEDQAALAHDLFDAPRDRRVEGARHPRKPGRACAKAARAGALAPFVAAVTEAVDRRLDERDRSGRTPGSPLTTRETVFRLNPATFATSLMVGRALARGWSETVPRPVLDNVVILS